MVRQIDVRWPRHPSRPTAFGAVPVPNLTIDHTPTRPHVSLADADNDTGTGTDRRHHTLGRRTSASVRGAARQSLVQQAASKITAIDRQLHQLHSLAESAQTIKDREVSDRAKIESALRRSDVLHVPQSLAPRMGAEHARVARIYAQRPAAATEPAITPYIFGSSEPRFNESRREHSAKSVKRGSGGDSDTVRLHADAVIAEATGPVSAAPLTQPRSHSKPGWKSWRTGPGTNTNTEVNLAIAAIDAHVETPSVPATRPLVLTIKPAQWREFRMGDRSIGKGRVRDRMVEDAATFRAKKKIHSKTYTTTTTVTATDADTGAFDDAIGIERRKQLAIQSQLTENQQRQSQTIIDSQRSLQSLAQQQQMKNDRQNFRSAVSQIYDTQFVHPRPSQPTSSGSGGGNGTRSGVGQQHYHESDHQYYQHPSTDIDSSTRAALEREIAAYRSQLAADLAHIEHCKLDAQMRGRSAKRWQKEEHRLRRLSAKTTLELKAMEHQLQALVSGDGHGAAKASERMAPTVKRPQQRRQSDKSHSTDHSNHHHRHHQTIEAAQPQPTQAWAEEPISPSRQPRPVAPEHLSPYQSQSPPLPPSVAARPAITQTHSSLTISPSRRALEASIERDISDMIDMLKRRAASAQSERYEADQQIHSILGMDEVEAEEPRALQPPSPLPHPPSASAPLPEIAPTIKRKPRSTEIEIEFHPRAAQRRRSPDPRSHQRSIHWSQRTHLPKRTVSDEDEPVVSDDSAAAHARTLEQIRANASLIANQFRSHLHSPTRALHP